MLKKILLFFSFLFMSVFISNCSSSLFYQARNDASNGNYKQAISKYKQIILYEPENSDALRELGISYYKNNDPDNALAALKQALQIRNDDGYTIFYLGLVNESLSDYDTALNYYKLYVNLGMLNSGIKDIIEGRIQYIAKRKIESEIKAALKNETDLKADTSLSNSIAILNFRNIGNNKDLDPLQKGLTDMLITDLSKVKKLKVIERARLQLLLDEIGLGKSGLVDAESSPRIGRIFGTSNLVKGTYLDLDASNFSMGVGLIKTSTGEYNDLTKVNGKIEDLFKLEKELAFSTLDKMGIKITDEEREQIKIIPTESYLAFVAYCKGLDLEDQGRYSEAAEEYKRASDIDPNYKDANTKEKGAENLDKASTDLGSVEKEIKQESKISEQSIMDRLAESNYQLTGENLERRDDRNPATTSNFGRGVQVEVEVILPPQ